MTREEAIKVIEIIEKRFITLDKEELQALEMAIKALEQEPIYYPPCQDCHTKMNEIVRAYDNVKSLDDAVSRQAIIAEMRKLYPDIPFVDFNNARLKWTRKYKPYLDCEEVVKSMPSVLPKRESEDKE